MEQRKDGYLGKELLIIFEDGADGHVSKKSGICTTSNHLEIVLDNKHIIPRNRIIRAEVLGGSHG